MIAVDSNLLIYAHRAATPEHRAARRALERAAGGASGWGIALPSIAEFWAVVTHPAASGRPSTGGEASRFIASLVTAGAQLWLPGAGFAERLLRVAADRKVMGARIFDLQIALIALESGARELWTHDRAFQSLTGLVTHDPLGP
ncbi:MAG: type II toxin-antitoxin system VapC family toxin [Candidatus Rokuibacteriota bacterium]